MKLDPKSRAATSFFMVIAVIMMLALAWSVSQKQGSGNSDKASQTIEQSQE